MRLALHTWGSPDAGKTALLIHGVMSSYGSWVRVAPELAGRGYYVIAPDLRGHGNSPHADSYISEDFAGDLVESLPKGADVAIGHSLGGRSLLLAVDALAPARAVYSDPAWVLSGAAAEVIAIMQEFAEATKVMTERHIQQLNPRWAVEDVASEKAGFAAWDVKVIDAVARFGDLDVPVPKVPSLVQIADPSYLITQEFKTHLTELGYATTVIKNTGHVMHREDLRGFMTSLEGFI